MSADAHAAAGEFRPGSWIAHQPRKPTPPSSGSTTVLNPLSRFPFERRGGPVITARPLPPVLVSSIPISLVLLLAPVAPAQNGVPQLAAVREQLRGESLEGIAHGAAAAAKWGLQKSVPELQGALQRLGKQKRVRWAAIHLMDALIRLSAKVTPQAIRRFARDDFYYPMPLILMVRHPKTHEEGLLRMLQNHKDHGWSAAGNALAEIRSKRFVAHVLSTTQVRLHVTIRVPNTKVVPGRGEDILIEEIEELEVPDVPARKGYPQIPVYRLHGDRESAKPAVAVALCKGAVPVFFSRRPRPEEEEEGVEVVVSERSPEHRVHWLAQVLGVKRSQIPLQASVRVEFGWRDARTYERKLEIERQKIAGGYRALVNRWASSGLVDPKSVGSVQIRTHVTGHAPAPRCGLAGDQRRRGRADRGREDGRELGERLEPRPSEDRRSKLEFPAHRRREPQLLPCPSPPQRAPIRPDVRIPN